MSGGVRIRGDRKLKRGLTKRVPKAARKAMQMGIEEEGAEVFEVSQNLVPIDKHTLQRDGFVKPLPRAPEPSIKLGYANNYALIQHERMDFQHAPGREAKYLEKPIRKARRGFNRRVARRSKRMFERLASA